MDFYEYFRATTNGLWQWEEDATVISFVDGSTICYRDYLVQVLQTLEPQGIPPLTSLLLAIAATNLNSGDEVQNRLSNLSNAGPHIMDAHRFVGNLSQLPAEYLNGRKRLLLFQTIFQNCHNLYNSKKAKRLIEQLKSEDLSVYHLNLKVRASNTQDYNTIGLMGARFKTVQDILDAMVSLGDIDVPEIEELELDIIAENDEKDFVEELIQNPKTFLIGSLIKRIWSGLHIPQNPNASMSQPLGGFADISNKGDFDKLLVSEFAFDDLSMVSRLANNESLFIQKDVPPSDNIEQRMVVIDVGLKNWGKSKTFAFAVALSLANHPKDKKETSIFIIGEDCSKVDHDTINGIIDANLKLSPSLDSSNGLNDFFQNYADQKSEIVFISEESVLEYPQYKKTFSTHRDHIDFIIQVNNEGQLDLYKNSKKGKKHLQNMTISYKLLWRKKLTSKSDEMIEPSSVDKFSILYRKTGVSIGLIDGHFYRMTKEGGLLKRYYRSTMDIRSGWHENGFELLYENVGRRKHIYCIGKNDNDELVLLSYQSHSKSLLLENLTTKNVIKLQFEGFSESKSVFLFVDGMFCCENNSEVNWISLDGEIVVASLTDELREKLKTEINKVHEYGDDIGNLLKNVHSVYINERREIVLNKHRLFVNDDDEAKFKISPRATKLEIDTNLKIEAVKISDQFFKFDDGSVVEINRNGMFILRSSDETIKPICINAILDVPLGMATSDFYTGDKMDFYKGNRYKVGIRRDEKFYQKDLREEMLEIAEEHGFVIPIYKSIIDESFFVPGLVSEEESIDIIADYEEIGISAFANCVDDIHQKIMRPATDFYSKFVQKFIANIVDHAAET